jgi:hypothetical protein
MQHLRSDLSNVVSEHAVIPAAACVPIAGIPACPIQGQLPTITDRLGTVDLTRYDVSQWDVLGALLEDDRSKQQDTGAKTSAQPERERKRRHQREHEVLTRAAEMALMIGGACRSLSEVAMSVPEMQAHEKWDRACRIARYSPDNTTPEKTDVATRDRTAVAAQIKSCGTSVHRRTGAGELERQAVQVAAAHNAVVTRIADARQMRASVRVAHPIVPSAKGYVVVAPGGATCASTQRLASIITAGVAIHPRGASRAATVNMVVTLPSGSTPTTEYLQYIARRVTVAVGRNPDLHAVACVHVPARHVEPGADGKPIQPHIHMTLATFDPITGTAWRCPHLHIVVQRELVAIDLERCGESHAPAVAAGKKLGLLYGTDRLQCISETIDGRKRVHSLDGDDILAEKAAIIPPRSLRYEPPAGLVVTRPSATPNHNTNNAMRKVVSGLRKARESLASESRMKTISLEDAVWAAGKAADATNQLVAAAGHGRAIVCTNVVQCALQISNGNTVRAYALVHEVEALVGNEIVAALDYDRG